ncbi:Alpha/Beta hydrolase protein [Phaeosphaeria sp. MPI-PUGE-AT-0046c]|nr:Alpha/Beta hydrolase protein [Phaeosphaeria sp. MPI-PUGE-AT-0046c]
MALSKALTALLLAENVLSSPISGAYNARASSLDWKPCDLKFSSAQQAVIDAHEVPLYCSNLKVPLDYTDEKSGATLDLQLIQVKASKEPVKGSIIMNPGGPGASGIEEISSNGPMYREVFGGQWNVIGFDARGTGRTIPFACDPVNETTSSLVRRAQNFTIPQNDMYDVLTTKAWDSAALYVEACAETKGNKDIASVISTPFVVRDMVNIVDALGEDGLLRFWGRSYSTVVGQTFAAMFPERVGRIMLDSVVRFEEYYSSTWASSTRDTEVAVLSFFKACVQAGPTLCPIANFTGPNTTPESLNLELADILQELIDNPEIGETEIKLPTQEWWQPGTPLYQTIKMLYLSQSYRPDQFPALWTFSDAIFKRDWEGIITTLKAPAAGAKPSNSTDQGSSNTTAEMDLPWHLGLNALHGISCSDTARRAEKPEDMYSLLQSQRAQGSWADVLGPQTWVCPQWPFAPKEIFNGPFIDLKTKNPILLINGAFDPITPLSGAWDASANLPGSRLLVHNGHGHGVMNHPSNCTIKAIHDYFNDGTLPEVGAKCEPNQPAVELAVEAAEAAVAAGPAIPE